MARKSRKPKASRPVRKPRVTLGDRWDAMDPRRRREIAVGALAGLAIAVAVVGSLWALGRMRRFVLTDPVAAKSSAAVELADRPDWMTDRLYAELCAELADPASPDGQGNWTYDADLARRVGQRATRCLWVRKLTDVHVYRAAVSEKDSRFRAGRVVVSAEWRKPVAIARWTDNQGRPWDQYIDAFGVVLPRDQVDPQYLPRIVGLAAPPSAPGQLWAGEDLQTGLTIIKLIAGKPYADQLERCDVSNHESRLNPWQPPISLIFRSGQYETTVVWGQMPTEGIPIGEPSTQRKLAYLDGWYAREDSQFGKLSDSIACLRSTITLTRIDGVGVSDLGIESR